MQSSDPEVFQRLLKWTSGIPAEILLLHLSCKVHGPCARLLKCLNISELFKKEDAECFFGRLALTSWQNVQRHLKSTSLERFQPYANSLLCQTDREAVKPSHQLDLWAKKMINRPSFNSLMQCFLSPLCQQPDFGAAQIFLTAPLMSCIIWIYDLLTKYCIHKDATAVYPRWRGCRRRGNVLHPEGSSYDHHVWVHPGCPL